MYALGRGRLWCVWQPFKPLLCMAKPLARRAVFRGVLLKPGGQAECGQPPPACGRRVVHTERAGSSVVNPGTGEAGCPHPCGVGSWVVHTLVVWAAGLSTRARCCDRCVSWLLCFLGFLFRLPAGAAGDPPVGPCTHGPTPAAMFQTMSAGRSAQARSSWLWPSCRVSVPNFVSYRCLDVHLLIISAGFGCKH